MLRKEIGSFATIPRTPSAQRRVQQSSCLWSAPHASAESPSRRHEMDPLRGARHSESAVSLSRRFFRKQRVGWSRRVFGRPKRMVERRGHVCTATNTTLPRGWPPHIVGDWDNSTADIEASGRRHHRGQRPMVVGDILDHRALDASVGLEVFHYAIYQWKVLFCHVVGLERAEAV